MSGREGRRTKDDTGIRAAEFQPDLKPRQVYQVENIKDIYIVLKMFDHTLFTTDWYSGGA